MNELTSTRHNQMIDPNLHIWGWEIAFYLFLGGLVAGIMIIMGYFLFMKREKETDSCFKVLPYVGILALSVGMFVLFLDLEHKLHTWRMYTTFQIASPMSWGAWILIFVYPAMLVAALIKPIDVLTKRYPIIAQYSERIYTNTSTVRIIAVVNIILGAMLGIYTGVLLSSFVARPLWNSSILGILFLVSGLSSAAALVHMISKNVSEREMLAKADNVFLSLELVVLALFIIGLLSSSAVQINAAKIILSGPYAPFFWVFVICTGIVIPLFIQILAVSHKIRHTSVAPLLVLLGGLLLRFVIVYAGQYSEWTTTTLLK